MSPSIDLSPIESLTQPLLTDPVSTDLFARICRLWIHHGHAPQAQEVLVDRLQGSHGAERCVLLSTMACAMFVTGADPEAALDEAERIAQNCWMDAEPAWTALGGARLFCRRRLDAHAALTGSDNPYQFEALPALVDLARAHHRAADWERLQKALEHIGPGHDQAAALRAIVDDALDRQALPAAITALWWIPEPLRIPILLRQLLRLVVAGELERAWRFEAQWDGLVGADASRALARALLGDVGGARDLMAPLLVGRKSAGPARDTMRYLAAASAAVGSVHQARWCIEQIAGVRPRLRAVCLSMRVAATDASPLLGWAVSLGETEEERVEAGRVVGMLEVRSGERPAGCARLRAIADLAADIDHHYQRRLALQTVAHAQIASGDVDGGLETAGRLRSRRFGYEHLQAAARTVAMEGATRRAAALLGRLPPRPRSAGAVQILETLSGVGFSVSDEIGF
ncbi:MAG: hypothetical protein AAFV53_26380 [Myxococcota bacterium]